MKWRVVLVLAVLYLSSTSAAPKRGAGKRPKGRPMKRKPAPLSKANKDDAGAAETTESSGSAAVSVESVESSKSSGGVAASALGLLKKPVAKMAFGLVAAGLVVVRVRKLIAARAKAGGASVAKDDKKAFSRGALDPASAFAELFAVDSKNAVLGDTSTGEVVDGADAWAKSSGEGYTILLFDVDSPISDTTDEKARSDYFRLMGNLTAAAAEKNAAPLQTLYVPGKGNKNLLEKQEAASAIGKGSWKYLSSHKGSRGADVAAALRQKYGVNGEELRIVVLGPDHKVITDHGLDCLRVDPYGLPWKPEPLAGLLSQGGLLGGSGANVSSDVSLDGKNTAIYFSASWCQPCKKFTPQLVEAYHAAMADGYKEKLDVLFVSLDSEEEAFDKYRSSMPWPAVAFKDTRRALLQIGLGIKSIPALVVLDPAGKVLSSSGVTEIATNKTLTDLISAEVEAADLGKSVEILQRHPVCIAICDDGDHTKTQALMTDVAQSSSSPVMVPRGPRESLVHCVLDKSSKMAEAIRSLCGLGTSPEGSVDVVVLDLVQELFGHTNLPSADSASIKKFSESYQAYSLPMKAINAEATTSAASGR